MRLSLLSPLDRWRAPAPGPDKVAWLGDWAYAHRGLHGPGAPENGETAFAAAIAKGMGIECDVQRSADGQAMVFHDPELDRLTAESGPLADRTAADLDRIKLLGSRDRIPTLRQLLAMTAGKVPLLVEIKSPGSSPGKVSALCLAVHRAIEGYRGPLAVMSFDPRVVRWFADKAPLTLRGLVVTEEDAKALAGRLRRHLWLWHAKPQFLAYDVRDLPSRFAEAQRQRGLPLLTWTVRSPELAERATLHADAPIAEGAGVA